MPNEIALRVFRRLDNRIEGLDDDSPRAVELHKRRKLALHEVLDNDGAWIVLNWGATNDPKSHELVELLLAVTGTKLAAAAIPALTFLGGMLVKSAVETATSEAVKGLIAKLRRKQEDKQLYDFSLILPGGHTIQCDAPEQGSQLTITWADGKVRSVNYEASRADIAKLEEQSAQV
jgi:hypothetical protein